MEEVLPALQQAHGAQGNEVTVLTYVLVAALVVAAILLVVYRAEVTSGARSTTSFLGEVRSEIQKVTWPDREQLRQMTITIVVFVIIVALVIAALDFTLQWLLVTLPGRAG